MAKGILTLIPTPIDEDSPLEQTAFSLLSTAVTEHLNSSVFVIEDLRPGRRRWLRYKLPRKIVEDFVLYNEHTRKEAIASLLNSLHQGKNVFLMSDGGLPAFCDPGRLLVQACHRAQIKVTSTPFCNSISLALSLSGLKHDRFSFEGFVPLKNPQRSAALLALWNDRKTVILMDTPYRMKKLLEELQKIESQSGRKREVFLAMDLCAAEEELFLGSLKSALNSITSFKREFILILAST